MHKNKIHAIVWVALMLAAATACGRKDDGAAIQDMIAKGAELAEKHEIGDLMRLTAEGFTATPGPHSAAQVRGILFAAFRHYGVFDIHYPRPIVTVDENGNSGSAYLYFIIVSRGRAIPGLKELYDDPRQWLQTASEKADLYKLELDLIKKKGDWRVRQATLDGFKGWGF
jgi:hypothetical protein